MTHPYREELAGRCEAMADEFAKVRPQIGSDGPTEALLREAAAALRQSPSVEEIETLIRRHVTGSTVECNGRLLPGLGVNGAEKAAQAIAALYGRGG